MDHILLYVKISKVLLILLLQLCNYLTVLTDFINCSAGKEFMQCMGAGT